MEPVDSHAADTLQTRLARRLAEYEEVRTAQQGEEQIQVALTSPRWELRCAALQALAGRAGAQPPAELLVAVRDEHACVRAIALNLLSAWPDYLILPHLRTALRDPSWLVREQALLSLGSVTLLPAEILEAVSVLALNDPDSAVRAAADRLLSGAHSTAHPTPDSNHVPLSHDRRSPTMLLNQEPVVSEHRTLASPPVQKRRFPRPLLAVATLLFAIFVLSGATFAMTWWNPLFGNPDLYQSFALQQSSQHITIQLNKAYADEGRTIIVYTISAPNPDQSATITRFDLHGSSPQQAVAMTSTECHPAGAGENHCFDIEPAFLVPSGVNSVQVTWNIKQVQLTPSGGEGKPVAVMGTWHFAFTLTFHHETRHDLPNPLQNGAVLP